jgi:hypothetical protein
VKRNAWRAPSINRTNHLSPRDENVKERAERAATFGNTNVKDQGVSAFPSKAEFKSF